MSRDIPAICVAIVSMTVVICITYGCVETTKSQNDYERGWRSDRQAIDNVAAKVRELQEQVLKLKAEHHRVDREATGE